MSIDVINRPRQPHGKGGYTKLNEITLHHDGAVIEDGSSSLVTPIINVTSGLPTQVGIIISLYRPTHYHSHVLSSAHAIVISI